MMKDPITIKRTERFICSKCKSKNIRERLGDILSEYYCVDCGSKEITIIKQ